MKLTLPLICDLCQGADIRTITSLEAAGKGITSLDDDLSPCVELRKVDLSNNKLAKTNPLGDLPQLSWLNLSHNDLRAIKGLTKVKTLITLNASHNNMPSIQHLVDIPSLKALVVNNNHIKSLDGVRQLHQLTAFVASHNQIEEIDDREFLHLAELRKLSLSHNVLRKVPVLKNCSNLKELRLNNNKITALPGDLVYTGHLCLLDVGNNLIRSFDDIAVLSKMVFLTNLNLKGNPICENKDYTEKILALVPGLRILDGKNLAPKKRKFKPRSKSSEGAATPAEGGSTENGENPVKKAKGKEQKESMPLANSTKSTMPEAKPKHDKKKKQDQAQQKDVKPDEQVQPKEKKAKKTAPEAPSEQAGDHSVGEQPSEKTREKKQKQKSTEQPTLEHKPAPDRDTVEVTAEATTTGAGDDADVAGYGELLDQKADQLNANNPVKSGILAIKVAKKKPKKKTKGKVEQVTKLPLDFTFDEPLDGVGKW
eukprot:m.8778 g.8778  ORF g.8778 m.8778 type:complete len:482 (+) comp5533_c0_seq1:146-1591(+)